MSWQPSPFWSVTLPSSINGLQEQETWTIWRVPNVRRSEGKKRLSWLLRRNEPIGFLYSYLRPTGRLSFAETTRRPCPPCPSGFEFIKMVSPPKVKNSNQISWWMYPCIHVSMYLYVCTCPVAHSLYINPLTPLPPLPPFPPVPGPQLDPFASLGAGTTKGTRKTSVTRCFSNMFPVRRASRETALFLICVCVCVFLGGFLG